MIMRANAKPYNWFPRRSGLFPAFKMFQKTADPTKSTTLHEQATKELNEKQLKKLAIVMNEKNQKIWKTSMEDKLLKEVDGKPELFSMTEKMVKEPTSDSKVDTKKIRMLSNMKKKLIDNSFIHSFVQSRKKILPFTKPSWTIPRPEIVSKFKKQLQTIATNVVKPDLKVFDKIFHKSADPTKFVILDMEKNMPSPNATKESNEKQEKPTGINGKSQQDDNCEYLYQGDYLLVRSKKNGVEESRFYKRIRQRETFYNYIRNKIR